jgi:hypothetical protein
MKFVVKEKRYFMQEVLKRSCKREKRKQPNFGGPPKCKKGILYKGKSSLAVLIIKGCTFYCLIPCREKISENQYLIASKRIYCKLERF